MLKHELVKWGITQRELSFRTGIPADRISILLQEDLISTLYETGNKMIEEKKEELKHDK